MREELNALEKKGKNLVKCKWVFALKYKVNGSLERYKARLVAKGYTRTYGVDYQETFAPVAKMNIVRILLSLAAHFNWQLQKYDVKNASLHRYLQEEIYMKILLEFEGKGMTNNVCRLRKALYGLKQCHTPTPALGGRRVCETELGLFTCFFRHWWAQVLQLNHNIISKDTKNKTTTLVVIIVSIHTVLSPIYIYIYKNYTLTVTFT